MLEDDRILPSIVWLIVIDLDLKAVQFRRQLTNALIDTLSCAHEHQWLASQLLLQLIRGKQVHRSRNEMILESGGCWSRSPVSAQE